MKAKLIILFIVSLLVPSVSAKNCNKGKPCGNSCINISYTCRVGTSSPQQTLAPTPQPAPVQIVEQRPDVEIGKTYYATFVRAVDGDTAVFWSQGAELTIRFIGIDTPETKHPQKPVEAFGPEAAALTEATLSGAQEIYLEFDVGLQDRFGRYLAYVYADGVMLNEHLVGSGLAVSSTYAPNVKYEDRFLAAQQQARAQGLNLWQ